MKIAVCSSCMTQQAPCHSHVPPVKHRGWCFLAAQPIRDPACMLCHAAARPKQQEAASHSQGFLSHMSPAQIQRPDFTGEACARGAIEAAEFSS